MDLEFSWRLPSAYHKPKVAARLSADAQVYVRCRHCAREARVDTMFLQDGDGEAFGDFPCKACGHRGFDFIRHREHRTYTCADCGHACMVATARFVSDRCPRCASSRLVLKSSEIQPPYPRQFDEMFTAKDEPWGVSAAADCMYIVRSTQALNNTPEFPLYLLTDILFAERLEQYGGYDASQDLDHLVNLRGNSFRDYFRRTGEIPAGVQAVTLFEACVKSAKDPVNRALMEHNLAMAIYSLLSRYEEDLIATLCRDPDVRRRGIAAAERALAVFEGMAQGRRVDGPGRNLDRAAAQMQCARIEHILGDLHKVGHATQSDFERSVAYLTKAIDRGVLDPYTTAGVRESRGTTVAHMDNPPPALLDRAIEDFEAFVASDDRNRVWSEKWNGLFNLSTLYAQRGDLPQAVAHAEHAAALALHEIGMVADERVLQQKGRVYGHLIDRVAGVFAKARRGGDALALLESFRGMTLRIHTMTGTEHAEAKKRAAASAVQSALGGLLGGRASHTKVRTLTLDPVAPRIRPLWAASPRSKTGFVSLSVASGVVTVLVPSEQDGDASSPETVQWRVDEQLLSVLARYFGADPPTERRAFLAELCTEGYRGLLQPMEGLLGRRNMARVGLTANGPLGQLPFEAFTPDAASGAAADAWRTFFYLPSLVVGANLAARERPRQDGWLLIVGYADTDLPATVDEVARLRRLFADRVRVLDTTRLSKPQVLEILHGDYDYIHFTCHGSFDLLTPLDSALHLKQNPDDDRHRITARDLLDVRLRRAAAVTLSACSTACIGMDTSNSFAGLTGSLLRCGARCVIGSRWPVLDQPALEFMTDFYTAVRKGDSDLLDCFAAAQRESRKTRGPEDWAAFSYVGAP